MSLWYYGIIQVEELRRKYGARIQEQEEQIETLLVKINNLEKQKSRLQSEVEVLIIDLEKVWFHWSFNRFVAHQFSNNRRVFGVFMCNC